MIPRSKNNTQKAKTISARAVIVLAIFFLMVFVFGFIAKEIFYNKEADFDNLVFAFLDSHQSEQLTHFFSFITFFGSTNFLLPAYIILSLLVLFYEKNIRRSLNITAVGLSSTALLFLAKFFFKRARPTDPLINAVPGFSFPSGHSFSSFTLAGIIVYVFWKSNMPTAAKWFWSLAVFLFATFIATSRVYLHVHYASDVVAGFCLSIIWLTLSVYLLNVFMNKTKS